MSEWTCCCEYWLKTSEVMETHVAGTIPEQLIDLLFELRTPLRSKLHRRMMRPRS